MNKTWKAFLLVSCSLIFLAGCTTRLVDFTAISTKNIKLPSATQASRAEGKDCVYMILSIPTGTPNMKEAIDRAIESGGREYDALVDGVLFHTFWHAILLGEMCYKIEGTPINTKTSVSMNDDQKENLMLHSRLSGSTALH